MKKQATAPPPQGRIWPAIGAMGLGAGVLGLGLHSALKAPQAPGAEDYINDPSFWNPPGQALKAPELGPEVPESTSEGWFRDTEVPESTSEGWTEGLPESIQEHPYMAAGVGAAGLGGAYGLKRMISNKLEASRRAAANAQLTKNLGLGALGLGALGTGAYLMSGSGKDNDRYQE